MTSVVSLLVLLLLLVETPQGIRFEEESRKIVLKESVDGQRGRARKLMTKAMTVPAPKTTEGTDKSTRREDYHVEPPETYHDVLDIAGMDYSPAKRKPPIHN